MGPTPITSSNKKTPENRGFSLFHGIFSLLHNLKSATF